MSTAILAATITRYSPMLSARAFRLSQQLNSGGLLPKTGSLQAEWQRCGKPTCRWNGKTLHGPYWSLRWERGAGNADSMFHVSR